MNTEIETQETQETKSRGGRPKNPAPPTSAAAVRELMAAEVVRSQPDKDRLRFLGELLVSFEGVEARAETAASKLLPATVAERDTLLARVNELEPLAAQLPDMTAQYNALKTDFDTRIAAMREELVAEARQREWAAARAENATKDRVGEAEAKFGREGLQLMLDFVRKLVEQFSIPEPDTETLPAGISPLVLTLWGHSRVRASLMIGYAKSFPTPSEDFTNTLFRVLRAGLPQYEGMAKADPIPDIDVKRDVLVSMARSWNVLDEVQRRVDAEQVSRQADFLRNHYAQMHSEEQASALRGEGRTSIVPEVPASSVPLSEHLIGCGCRACGGSGRVDSEWSGFIPAAPGLSPRPLSQPTKKEEEER
jgi:hypothetical protein